MNFKSLFTPASVDSILAAFDKQQAKLNTLAGKLRDHANRHQQDAEDLLQRASEKKGEADRALRVANKIRNLID